MIRTRFYPVLLVLSFCLFMVSWAFAQTTPGGTVITNQATATYADGSGNNFNAISNIVNVTVANVAGLVITPDAGSSAAMVPNEVKVLTFTLQNTGNFANPVQFLPNGSSVQLTGAGTVLRAVIDVDNSGTITPGDTDIFTNPATVNSAAIAAAATARVLVEIQVNNSAVPGSMTLNLGDTASGGPGFDNQVADSSANEVRTTDASAVNGLREAKGSFELTIQTDAVVRVDLTVPAGPVTPGSDINYAMVGCNTGGRDVKPITIAGAPIGSNSSIFLIAPIPANSTLKAGQAFPANTLYTTDPLTVVPTAASWSTAQPDLATITRIAIPQGNLLAVGTCTASVPFVVTVNPGVNPTLVPTINEIVDIFGTNDLNAPITDQSGDPVAGAGDGNANFDEGNPVGSVDGNGVIQTTALTGASDVWMGPQGNAGSTRMNNAQTLCEHYDHTTSPAPDFSTLTGNYVFVSPKTIENKGTLPFSFLLIQGHKQADFADTPNFLAYTGDAAGTFFDNATDILTEVSFNGGGTWIPLQNSAGLSWVTSNLTSTIHTKDTLGTSGGGLTLNPGQSVNYLARYTIPTTYLTARKNFTVTTYIGLYFAGTQNPMFPSYQQTPKPRDPWTDTTTGTTYSWAGTCPGNTTFESSGDTIISGSVDVVKSAIVQNSTGVGAATDAVPGAEIEYTLTITGKLPNTVPNPATNIGPWDFITRLPLTSSSVSLTEDGALAPNNWATHTTQVVGSASCSLPATITGDSAGSNSLTFTLTNPLTAGQVVTCAFRRKIN